MTDTDDSDYLKTAYDQLCTSFRAIDDFRGKLLGFLPLVTGGGLVLLTGPTGDVRREFLGPVGLFGMLVTVGLLVYELNGIKRCLELVEDGKELEDKMKLKHAQFISRRERPFSIGSKQFAAAWIYPAVLAAWIYLALLKDHRDVAKVISPTVFIVGWWESCYTISLCALTENQNGCSTGWTL